MNRLRKAQRHSRTAEWLKRLVPVAVCRIFRASQAYRHGIDISPLRLWFFLIRWRPRPHPSNRHISLNSTPNSCANPGYRAVNLFFCLHGGLRLVNGPVYDNYTYETVGPAYDNYVYENVGPAPRINTARPPFASQCRVSMWCVCHPFQSSLPFVSPKKHFGQNYPESAPLLPPIFFSRVLSLWNSSLGNGNVRFQSILYRHL